MGGVSGMSSLQKKNVAKFESDYVAEHDKKVQTVGKKRRGLLRRLTLYGICAILISVFSISTLVSQAASLEEKNEKVETLRHNLSELKDEEQLLKEEIIKLNDDEYITKLARKEYFLSNEGEVIFSLPKK